MVTVKNRFRPYRDATLDSTLAHFICRPCLPCIYPLMRVVLPCRWFLAQPLKVYILPKCLPKIPGLGWMAYVTFGQILLALPQIYLLFRGYNETFIYPDVNNGGHTASFSLVLTYLSILRSNSSASYLFGIPHDRLIFYHGLSAVVAVILGIMHTYVAFVYDNVDTAADASIYSVHGGDPKFIKYCVDNKKNASGTILLLFMCLLVGTSLFPILRRWYYNSWLFTHITSAIAVVIFSFQHKVNVVVIGSAFWIIDLFVRRIVMLVRYPTKATVKPILPDVVEMKFRKSKGFDYTSGQYVYVAVPKISIPEFHPVTISSAPHEPEVTLHIKVLGDWSQKLHELCKDQKELTIFLEGPYGSLSVDLNNDRKYQMVLMISGGIGATPCQSITKSLLKDHEGGRRLHQIRYIWAVKDLDMPLAISPLSTNKDDDDYALANSLEAPLIKADGNECPLQMDVYITKPSEEERKKEEERPIIPFNVHEGRPDLDEIFEEVKVEAAQNGFKYAAVISCGPTSMVEKVKEACRKHSPPDLYCCAGVTFDLHEEIFEY